MAFTPEEPKVPAAIGTISIVLTDPVNEIGTIDFVIEVLEADGSIFRVLDGNLIPHLTTGQKNALLAFMDDMRIKAESEILP